MNKEWSECYEYFKNRKFIEKPPKTLVNLKQTTIIIPNANANCSMYPKSVSHLQKDSEESEEPETGRTSTTTRNSCGQRDFEEINNHPRDSF